MITFVTVLLLLVGLGFLAYSYFLPADAFDGLDGIFRFLFHKFGSLAIAIVLCWYSLYMLGVRITIV